MLKQLKYHNNFLGFFFQFYNIIIIIIIQQNLHTQLYSTYHFIIITEILFPYRTLYNPYRVYRKPTE